MPPPHWRQRQLLPKEQGLTENKQIPSARQIPDITVATSQAWPSAARSPLKKPAEAGSAVSAVPATQVGEHLIVDFWGARNINDVASLQRVIELAVNASGATLLHIHLHRFDDGEGVTGVALLAESHITVHTWPENDYAAFDIFMCGSTDPLLALEVLRAELRPVREQIQHIFRG